MKFLEHATREIHDFVFECASSQKNKLKDRSKAVAHETSLVMNGDGAGEAQVLRTSSATLQILPARKAALVIIVQAVICLCPVRSSGR